MSCIATSGLIGSLNIYSAGQYLLNPSGPNEVHGYFGCWLDLNQTDLRMPTQSFPGDGPYGVNVKSIQDSIRGLHQCLVADPLRRAAYKPRSYSWE
jgi:hypothetical protein